MVNVFDLMVNGLGPIGQWFGTVLSKVWVRLDNNLGPCVESFCFY